MQSVLISIKKLLGISEEYTPFDDVIIMHINSALMAVNQLGVGPEKPAYITDQMDTWQSTLGDIENVEAIKSYIYLKVRLLFDPPASSFVLESINRQITEWEVRLNIQAENNKEV